MSIFKKIKSVLKDGVEPIDEGMANFQNESMESAASERAKVCAGCESRVKEPISMFRVEDKKIPLLSERMCDECGCPLSYLLRQNIKICKKW